jgi:uncharacterized protein (TIGR02452 family)
VRAFRSVGAGREDEAPIVHRLLSKDSQRNHFPNVDGRRFASSSESIGRLEKVIAERPWIAEPHRQHSQEEALVSTSPTQRTGLAELRRTSDEEWRKTRDVHGERVGGGKRERVHSQDEDQVPVAGNERQDKGPSRLSLGQTHRIYALAGEIDRGNPMSDADLDHYFSQQLRTFVGEQVVCRRQQWCPPICGRGPEWISHWLATYGASRDGVALHAIRVAVMQQTYNLTKVLEATAPNAEDPFSPQNPLNPATASRIVSMRQPSRQQQAAQFPPCEPEVIVADCVDVARHLIDNELNPLLLNMASATSPGGGFLKGDGAQEENLHRRSNYYLATNSLEPHRQSVVRYPLPDDGGIYSPSITFFRGTEQLGYPICEPVSIACIAVAALRHPNILHRNGELVFASDSDRALMKQKVRLMFRAAAENGHDALVLGAFGCGAFKCPADAVARLMGEVNQEYRSVFRRVVIAIYDDHNSFNAVNVNGLVLPFCRALGTDPKYLTLNGPCALGGMCNVPGCSRTHPVQCKFGSECRETAPTHRRDFSHHTPNKVLAPARHPEDRTERFQTEPSATALPSSPHRLHPTALPTQQASSGAGSVGASFGGSRRANSQARFDRRPF